MPRSYSAFTNAQCARVRYIKLYVYLLEIEHFLSDAECEHIIDLATKQGLEISATMRESIETDVRNLGSNNEEEFKEWDRDMNGLIDISEVS